MNFLELSLYIITVMIMIVTPGPVMILVASAGIKGGYRLAFRTICGTNFASLLLISISILIIKGFLNINETLFLPIKVIGCLYIGYIGYSIVKEGFLNKKEFHITKQNRFGFVKGFLVGISNPKDIIFFSSFFPQFIKVNHDINHALLTLVVTWIVLDFSALSIVYKLFNSFSNSRLTSKLFILCGFILIAIALYGLISINLS